MRALGKKKINAGVRILAIQHKRVLQIAKREDKTFSEIVREAIDDWITKYKNRMAA